MIPTPIPDAIILFEHYQDRGCRLHPSCLECPRAVCIWDEPKNTGRRYTSPRSEAAARLVEVEGKTYVEAGAILGIKPLSVYRRLRILHKKQAAAAALALERRIP